MSRAKESVKMISDDSVTVTTIVNADPDTAFRIFTQEIDLWWKRGPRYRGHDGRVRFDGARLLAAEHHIGRVLNWEPGVRLLLEMWTWNFHPDERTQVEVHFELASHGTRVTIDHRGWERRPTARAEFRTTVALWWGALLPGFNKMVAMARSQEQENA